MGYMRICVPKEPKGETRVPITPQYAERLVKLGADVVIEAGLGSTCDYSDADYKSVGASIEKNKKKLFSTADIILRLNAPNPKDIKLMKKKAIHISYMEPFDNKALLSACKAQNITAFSMELIPRTSRAQKMDSLSSQASLAGYVAVMLAAERLDKVFPMMMTPAGTISPSRVFIIGAGVAGLQAIATAKRLGARVDAFDTRPVVEEQVQSLGAKFLKVDLGETGQTKGGYAKELTKEQIKKQQEAMKKQCALSDVVITTAALFGRKAPIIITKDMVKAMKPGSIIVDLAIETGGNTEGAKLGKEVNVGGVRIIGLKNLPGHVPVHSSQVYASNLFNFVDEFWDKEKKEFVVDFEDDILKGCCVTHEKVMVNDFLKSRGVK